MTKIQGTFRVLVGDFNDHDAGLMTINGSGVEVVGDYGAKGTATYGRQTNTIRLATDDGSGMVFKVKQLKGSENDFTGTVKFDPYDDDDDDDDPIEHLVWLGREEQS